MARRARGGASESRVRDLDEEAAGSALLLPERLAALTLESPLRAQQQEQEQQHQEEAASASSSDSEVVIASSSSGSDSDSGGSEDSMGKAGRTRRRRRQHKADGSVAGAGDGDGTASPSSARALMPRPGGRAAKAAKKKQQQGVEVGVGSPSSSSSSAAAAAWPGGGSPEEGKGPRKHRQRRRRHRRSGQGVDGAFAEAVVAASSLVTVLVEETVVVTAEVEVEVANEKGEGSGSGSGSGSGVEGEEGAGKKKKKKKKKRQGKPLPGLVATLADLRPGMGVGLLEVHVPTCACKGAEWQRGMAADGVVGFVAATVSPTSYIKPLAALVGDPDPSHTLEGEQRALALLRAAALGHSKIKAAKCARLTKEPTLGPPSFLHGAAMIVGERTHLETLALAYGFRRKAQRQAEDEACCLLVAALPSGSGAAVGGGMGTAGGKAAAVRAQGLAALFLHMLAGAQACGPPKREKNRIEHHLRTALSSLTREAVIRAVGRGFMLAEPAILAMGQEWPERYTVDAFGGKRELGESSLEAAIRETKEESGGAIRLDDGRRFARLPALDMRDNAMGFFGFLYREHIGMGAIPLPAPPFAPAYHQASPYATRAQVQQHTHYLHQQEQQQQQQQYYQQGFGGGSSGVAYYQQQQWGRGPPLTRSRARQGGSGPALGVPLAGAAGGGGRRGGKGGRGGRGGRGESGMG